MPHAVHLGDQDGKNERVRYVPPVPLRLLQDVVVAHTFDLAKFLRLLLRPPE